MEFLAPRETVQAKKSFKSQNGDVTPQRKDMDHVEFEQRPQVTRFKLWKTTFRQAVSTQQATVCLAEIDKAKSMQDLDDVGSEIGSTRMRFENMDSQITKGFMKIMNPEFTGEINSGFQRMARTFFCNTPDVDREATRQDAFPDVYRMKDCIV